MLISRKPIKFPFRRPPRIAPSTSAKETTMPAKSFASQHLIRVAGSGP